MERAPETRGPPRCLSSLLHHGDRQTSVWQHSVREGLPQAQAFLCVLHTDRAQRERTVEDNSGS